MSAAASKLHVCNQLLELGARRSEALGRQQHHGAEVSALGGCAAARAAAHLTPVSGASPSIRGRCTANVCWKSACCAHDGRQRRARPCLLQHVIVLVHRLARYGFLAALGAGAALALELLHNEQELLELALSRVSGQSQLRRRALSGKRCTSSSTASYSGTAICTGMLSIRSLRPSEQHDDGESTHKRKRHVGCAAIRRCKSACAAMSADCIRHVPNQCVTVAHVRLQPLANPAVTLLRARHRRRTASCTHAGPEIDQRRHRVHRLALAAGRSSHSLRTALQYMSAGATQACSPHSRRCRRPPPPRLAPPRRPSPPQPARLSNPPTAAHTCLDDSGKVALREHEVRQRRHVDPGVLQEQLQRLSGVQPSGVNNRRIIATSRTSNSRKLCASDGIAATWCSSALMPWKSSSPGATASNSTLRICARWGGGAGPVDPRASVGSAGSLSALSEPLLALRARLMRRESAAQESPKRKEEYDET